MLDSDDNRPRRKRGWARMRELDAQDAAERQALEAELLACLGRDPGAIDRIAVETLVASVIRARRLRLAGKNDTEERRIILQSIRATGIKPAPAELPEPPSPYAMLFGAEPDTDTDGEAANADG